MIEDQPHRIVFMGTPAFAVPALEALLHLDSIGGHQIRVAGVFTQPDRPAGRGQRLVAPPVKQTAITYGVPVYQPERLRRPDGMAALESLAPDLIVVAAYAQILSQRVLDMPRFHCLNLHASLLPRYRGAAPIQAAILDGVPETGVSVMLMEAGLDTGPVLAQMREPIRDDDTAASLSLRLAVAGADLLVRTIPDWIGGELLPTQQDQSLATLTRPLHKEDGRIRWSWPATRVWRHVRAMAPWPGAFTMAGDLPLKVLEAAPVGSVSAPPSTLLAMDGAPVVACGEGAVLLRHVQPAGRRPMSGADWLHGTGAALLGGLLGGESSSPSLT